MKTADFLGKVASFLATHGINPQSGIIVAYSGGADSGCLLKALSDLGLKKLRAVHVTHNLRSIDEGLAERRLASNVCRSLGVPLTVVKVRPGAIERLAELNKLGIEASARLYRYHAFEACALRFGYPAIATAHTMDDQLETLLVRILYSSGPEGLAGIPTIRKLKSGLTLFRPMLFASRNDVEEYARAGSLLWVTDSSNKDTRFLRNKVRSRLVPLLESEFPGWKTGLLGTSRKMIEAGAALSSVVTKVLDGTGFETSTQTFTIPRKAFADLEKPFRKRLLTHAIGCVSPRSRLSGKAVGNAVSALESGALSLQILNTRIAVDLESITLSPLLDFQAERGYFFMIASNTSRKVGEMEIAVDWDTSGGNRMNYLLEGAFSFPLVVRSRKPGDSIVISGKSVRIDDLIKAWRLDGKARRTVPILEDEAGIVAVMPDAMEGIKTLGKARFRDYEGRRDGRMLRIIIKGA